MSHPLFLCGKGDGNKAHGLFAWLHCLIGNNKGVRQAGWGLNWDPWLDCSKDKTLPFPKEFFASLELKDMQHNADWL